jgi:uncharacterized damage-inducible protein DinB
MNISVALLAEFDEEMINTRKVLECVPGDKLAWKPHEKSFTLGRLANHIASLPVMPAFLIAGGGSRRSDATSKAELLTRFDETVAASREALAGMDDEYLAKTIRVTPDISKTVYAALRGRGLMNHLIHHRGQLTVYLRLLDVPLPGMYGPSADEKSVT